jgi:EAL domain-containing protein (putative c-di-GMP-specific phosphodiesterase class I)
MKLQEKVEQTVVSGVMPITLLHDTVHFFDEAPEMKRSFLQINSLELGTLTYRQYRFVARRTKQGEALVRRHLHGVLRAIPQMLQERRLSSVCVPVYARTLQSSKLAELLFEAFTLFPQVKPGMVCVEISADILFEDIELARERIAELHALGVKVAIGELGDEFCPIFRLASFQFEYAFLDSYAIEHLLDDNAEQSIGALVAYLHALQVRVIAPELRDHMQISRARELGCDGYTLLEREGGAQ